MMEFHSALAPEAVVEMLRREVGEARWSLSPLGRMHGPAFVGRMDRSAFWVRWRGSGGDHFASQFYGRVEAAPGGTRIVGSFDFPRWVRYFMRVWLVLAVVVAVPIFVVALMEVLRGGDALHGNVWAGLLVPPCFLAYALLLPSVGRWFGRDGERRVLEFLEEKVGARVSEAGVSAAETRGGTG